MSLLWDIKVLCYRAAVALLVVIAIITIGALMSTVVGCNIDDVADKTRQIIGIERDIQDLEEDISKAKSTLQFVPLEDLARAELEAQAKADEEELARKQAAKAKLVKSKEQSEQEDDDMIDATVEMLGQFLPLGFGGLAGIGGMWAKGLKKNRTMKKVLATIQPFVDALTDEQKAGLRESQGKDGNALVNKMQDRPTTTK